MRGAAASGEKPGRRRYTGWLSKRLPSVRPPSFISPLVSTTERRISLALLAIAVGFNLYILSPEVLVSAPTINDNTLHQIVLRQTEEALSRGWDPTDFWLRPVA